MHCISKDERHRARRSGFFWFVWFEYIVFGRFAKFRCQMAWRYIVKVRPIKQQRSCFAMSQGPVSVISAHHSTEQIINNENQMWHSSATSQLDHCLVVLATSNCVMTCWWWWHMVFGRWTSDISSVMICCCLITAYCTFNGFLLHRHQGCQPSRFSRKPPDFEAHITIVRFSNENCYR